LLSVVEELADHLGEGLFVERFPVKEADVPADAKSGRDAVHQVNVAGGELARPTEDFLKTPGHARCDGKTSSVSQEPPQAALQQPALVAQLREPSYGLDVPR